MLALCKDVEAVYSHENSIDQFCQIPEVQTKSLSWDDKLEMYFEIRSTILALSKKNTFYLSDEFECLNLQID